MTEIDRLLDEKKIDNAFLNEEGLCDFLVDTTRKKIWAIELDLLLEIDRVCQKYGLRYYLFWGSLLGAIRHNGFVPWDDDTDVVMPRNDYEQLLMHSEEFKSPYFLQTPFSDPTYYYAHAKLRNSNTSAIDAPFLYQGFNMGIFVDIMPIDKIDENNRSRELFNLISSINMQNSIAMRIGNPFLSERDKERVRQYKGGDPLARYNKLQKLSVRDKESNSDKLCVFAATTYGYDRDVFFEEDFYESIEWGFLGYSFPIPKGYDRILRIAYGNYLEFPPVEKRGQWHGNVSFFPDNPYPEMVEYMKCVLSKQDGS